MASGLRLTDIRSPSLPDLGSSPGLDRLLDEQPPFVFNVQHPTSSVAGSVASPRKGEPPLTPPASESPPEQRTRTVPKARGSVSGQARPASTRIPRRRTQTPQSRAESSKAALKAKAEGPVSLASISVAALRNPALERLRHPDDVPPSSAGRSRKSATPQSSRSRSRPRSATPRNRSTAKKSNQGYEGPRTPTVILARPDSPQSESEDPMLLVGPEAVWVKDETPYSWRGRSGSAFLVGGDVTFGADDEDAEGNDTFAFMGPPNNPRRSASLLAEVDLARPSVSKEISVQTDDVRSDSVVPEQGPSDCSFLGDQTAGFMDLHDGPESSDDEDSSLTAKKREATDQYPASQQSDFPPTQSQSKIVGVFNSPKVLAAATAAWEAMRPTTPPRLSGSQTGIRSSPATTSYERRSVQSGARSSASAGLRSAPASSPRRRPTSAKQSPASRFVTSPAADRAAVLASPVLGSLPRPRSHNTLSSAQRHASTSESPSTPRAVPYRPYDDSSLSPMHLGGVGRTPTRLIDADVDMKMASPGRTTPVKSPSRGADTDVAMASPTPARRRADLLSSAGRLPSLSESDARTTVEPSPVPVPFGRLSFNAEPTPLRRWSAARGTSEGPLSVVYSSGDEDDARTALETSENAAPINFEARLKPATPQASVLPEKDRVPFAALNALAPAPADITVAMAVITRSGAGGRIIDSPASSPASSRSSPRGRTSRAKKDVPDVAELMASRPLPGEVKTAVRRRSSKPRSSDIAPVDEPLPSTGNKRAGRESLAEEIARAEFSVPRGAVKGRIRAAEGAEGQADASNTEQATAEAAEPRPILGTEVDIVTEENIVGTANLDERPNEEGQPPAAPGVPELEAQEASAETTLSRENTSTDGGPDRGIDDLAFQGDDSAECSVQERSASRHAAPVAGPSFTSSTSRRAPSRLLALAEEGPSHRVIGSRIVEITSTDPRAAARAAAILKVHHRYIERGWTAEGDDTTHDESILALELDRSVRKEIQVSESGTVGRRSKSSWESQGTTRTDLCGDKELESLLHDAERDFVDRSTLLASTPHLADRHLRQPSIDASVRSSRAPYEPDFVAWGKQDWRALETVLRRMRRAHTAAGQQGDVDPEEVAERMLQKCGLDVLEGEGEWDWTKIVHRVVALQRRRSTSVASTAALQALDRQSAVLPTTAARLMSPPRNISTPRRLAQQIASLVPRPAPTARPPIFEKQSIAASSVYAPAFAPPTPDLLVTSRPIPVSRAAAIPSRLRFQAGDAQAELGDEDDGEDLGDKSNGSNTSRRGKRRSGSGKVWNIINRFEDDEDRREEETKRVEALSQSAGRKRSAGTPGSGTAKRLKI